MDLLSNLDKLHTTALGIERIKRNLCLDVDDIVSWCRQKIQDENSSIIRKEKNWYVSINDCKITINAYSYTIITAHKYKKQHK
jgi:hypothetical protein